MKMSIYRRIRRHRASYEAANTNKESKQERSFFGEASHETFFRPSPVIQRKCEQCREEDKKVQRQAIKEEEKLQKKEAGNTAGVSSGVNSYVHSLNGKGHSLLPEARQFFSQKMGYDFSNVKIHTGKEAAASAREVNAKAYTVGEHIVFNDGYYNTGSADGKKLMAHELTHVVQHSDLIQRQKISEEPPATDVAKGSEADTIKDDSKKHAFICDPVGLDRASFLKKGKAEDMGVTGPPTISLSQLSLEKYKKKFILQPFISYLHPIPSFFTRKGSYMEGKVHLLSESICHSGTGKTYPVKWTITAGGESQIKKAELEHCADFKYAFDITVGKYTAQANELAKNKVKFANLNACRKKLTQITGVDPDQWIGQFKAIAEATKLRDDKWHQPKPIEIHPHKIKDPLYLCDYFENKITEKSLPEVGLHPSSEIIK